MRQHAMGSIRVSDVLSDDHGPGCGRGGCCSVGVDWVTPSTTTGIVTTVFLMFAGLFGCTPALATGLEEGPFGLKS